VNSKPCIAAGLTDYLEVYWMGGIECETKHKFKNPDGYHN
jgi:hypothetical protein